MDKNLMNDQRVLLTYTGQKILIQNQIYLWKVIL